jgi:hypothetical protein
MAGLTRTSRLVAAVSLAAALAGAAQLAAPTPAEAVPGLHRVISDSATNRNPWKKAIASCGVGNSVLGGGAVVRDGGRNLVRLTRSSPSGVSDIDTDWWVAEAEAPDLRRDFDWSVTVYAVCAPNWGIGDHDIVGRTVTFENSPRFERVDTPRCPGNSVTYGSGAWVMGLDAIGGGGPFGFPTGRLGLQMIRTSGPLDIARATAREAIGGYAGQWRLNTVAICADRRIRLPVPGQYPDSRVRAVGSTSFTATAESLCPGDLRTHGPGGGGGLTDGGPSWLRAIHPHNGLGGITVALTAPLVPSIGGMAAHQTCAAY